MDEARMTAILDVAEVFFVGGDLQVLLRRSDWRTVEAIVRTYLGNLCAALGIKASLQSGHGPPLHERDRVHSLDHLMMLVRRHRRLQREQAT